LGKENFRPSKVLEEQESGIRAEIPDFDVQDMKETAQNWHSGEFGRQIDK
jgi:hypothetical protein